MSKPFVAPTKSRVIRNRTHLSSVRADDFGFIIATSSHPEIALKHYSNGVDIVLVHLNTRIPSYVKRNLTRLRDHFPSHQVVLISNINQSKIANVQFMLYAEPDESIDIKTNLSHPKNFRANFWHSSIARFAYLLTYQREKDYPILHVESDVILAKDFPFDLVSNNKHLAYPILSKYRGVASIFFSENAESLSHFVGFVVEEARADHEITDMTALRKYYDLHNERVNLLPAGPGSRAVYEPEIQLELLTQLVTELNRYSGVFDGSDIGMYLFGTDPRNKLGRTILRQEVASTYTRMSEMKFRFNSDRNFLDVESEEKWIPIYNLHMTCKNINLFTSKRMDRIFLKYLSDKRS